MPKVTVIDHKGRRVSMDKRHADILVAVGKAEYVDERSDMETRDMVSGAGGDYRTRDMQPQRDAPYNARHKRGGRGNHRERN